MDCFLAVSFQSFGVAYIATFARLAKPTQVSYELGRVQSRVREDWERYYSTIESEKEHVYKEAGTSTYRSKTSSTIGHSAGSHPDVNKRDP